MKLRHIYTYKGVQYILTGFSNYQDSIYLRHTISARNLNIPLSEHSKLTWARDSKVEEKSERKVKRGSNAREIDIYKYGSFLNTVSSVSAATEQTGVTESHMYQLLKSKAWGRDNYSFKYSKTVKIQMYDVKKDGKHVGHYKTIAQCAKALKCGLKLISAIANCDIDGDGIEITVKTVEV